MAVRELKVKGRGLTGRFVGMELVGPIMAGRNRKDGLFTVRLDYDAALGKGMGSRSEVFRYQDGQWENTTLLREDGEEHPTLFPRYRSVPGWLLSELEGVRETWEEAELEPPVKAKPARAMKAAAKARKR